MGVLSNQRHETFSQEIAKGTSIAKAYAIAGYPPSKGNAYRLRLNDRIKARINELTGFRTAAVEAAALDAAAKAGVDVFWVLRTLRRNSVMAARHGDRAASNRAAELIGRHIGMFVEKKSIEISYIDDSDEYLARIMAIVRGDGETIDNELPALPAADHGSDHGSDGQEPGETTDIIEESS